MQIIWEIIKYIIDLLLGVKKESDQKIEDANKKAESIIESKKEEVKVEKKVEEIKNEPPKFKDDNGGINFDEFNKKSKKLGGFILLFLMITSCCCDDNRYVAERFPVYTVPDRPYLENIPAEEFKGISPAGMQKIKKNYDLLIKWGESLEVIVNSYNEYAIKRNDKDPLYRKIK